MSQDWFHLNPCIKNQTFFPFPFLPFFFLHIFLMFSVAWGCPLHINVLSFLSVPTSRNTEILCHFLTINYQILTHMRIDQSLQFAQKIIVSEFRCLQTCRIEPANCKFLSCSLLQGHTAVKGILLIKFWKWQFAENKDGHFSNLKQILKIFIRTIQLYKKQFDWYLLIKPQIWLVWNTYINAPLSNHPSTA